MVGIEAGASRMTLSSGERVRFAHSETESGDEPATGEHGDILIRIGDEVPYVRISRALAGGNTAEIVSATDLYAKRLSTTLRADTLAGQQLGLAAQVSLAQPLWLAVPGWWAPAVLRRFDAALRDQGLTVTLVNAAEAAVSGYQLSGAALPQNVAVVDTRRSYTSVTIVRECLTHPQALLSPTFVHREGGDALDAAVLRHLVRGLESVGDTIDAASPETVTAARASLAQCRELRETLSSSATAAMQPELPGSAHRVLLVRSELDELATPWADAVIDMVHTAIEQSPVDVHAVLITGGLAAMPLLTQRLSADLALEIHVPEHLDTVIAQGAQVIGENAANLGKSKRGWLKMLRPKETQAMQGLVLR